MRWRAGKTLLISDPQLDSVTTFDWAARPA